MSKLIGNTLFYTIWLQICLLMVGGIMLWAILLTGYNYTVDFINKFLDRTILIYTGKTRKSFELATIHDKSENDIYKHRIKRLALRAYESFQDEDIDDIGYLLHEAWGEKKKISHKISSEGVEEIYNDLKNSGAIIGGKLLGAGGSGFLFCVLNKKTKSLVKYKKNIVNFGINWTGTKLIS